MTDERRASLMSLVVIIVAVGLAHVHLVFGGQTLIGRHLSELLPALGHIAAAISDARVAEWWDGVGLGVPFAANATHVALYPPAWLTAILPMPWGADVLLLAHLVLAGAGVCAAAQRLGSERVGATTVGAAFAIGGVMTSSMIDAGAVMGLAWTPWIAWAALGLADAATKGARARSGAAVAVFAAAQLHGGGLEAISASAVLAAALAAHRARSVTPLLTVALAFAGALLLAAWVVVPELSLSAPDPGGPATWSQLVELAVPPLDGPGMYIGAPLLFLAVLAAVRGGDGGRVLGAMALGFALLSVAVGRAHLVSAAVIVAALAARPLRDVLDAEDRRGLGAVGLGAAAAYAVAIIVAAVGGAAHSERSAGAVFVLALSVVALWLARAPQRRGHGIALLAAVLVGHLVADTWSSVPRTDRATIAARPGLLPAEVVSSPLRPRIYRPRTLPRARHVDERDPAYRHLVLRPNVGARFGYAHLRGIDRLRSRRLERVWRASAVAGERMLDLYGVELALLPSSIVLRTGMPVAAKVDGHPLALVHNRERRARAFVAPVWRRLPDDDAVLAALFPPVGRTPLRLGTVHLTGEGDDSAANGKLPAPPCQIESGRPELVRLRCPDIGSDGYVVLLDAFAPGWSATVDGVPAEIERADLLVRAVRVGEGAHVVEFRYRTPGLRLGAIVALLAWINLLVLLRVLRAPTATGPARRPGHR